jgi:hypothetical protein
VRLRVKQLARHLALLCPDYVRGALMTRDDGKSGLPDWASQLCPDNLRGAR